VPKSLLISIPLDISDMRVLQTELTKDGELILTVESTLTDTWCDLIANYFIEHQTSSFVEGLNNKLKMLKRRCYGLRNVMRLFQRLTLELEGYRRFSP